MRIFFSTNSRFTAYILCVKCSQRLDVGSIAEVRKPKNAGLFANSAQYGSGHYRIYANYSGRR